MTKHVFLASLVALGVPGGLAGQETGKWRVTPSIAMMRFDRTTALSSTASGLSTKLWPWAGLDAMYRVRSNVQVGLYLGGSRVTTSPDYFKYALFKSGSNYELWAVSQRVTVFNYGIGAELALPVGGAFDPYVKVGLGRHTLYPDVQKSNSVGSFSGAEFALGGGVRIDLKSSVALRLEITDFMWSNFDRERLDPVAPDFQNNTFPLSNPDGVLWPKPGLTHNLRLGLGFAFTPAGGGQ
jgi:opacity protein-like surface antigen